MGTKSKMCGARSRTFGYSRRGKKNKGAFGKKRMRGYESIVEIHSRHPRGQKSYRKEIVILALRSKRSVFLRKARTGGEV